MDNKLTVVYDTDEKDGSILMVFKNVDGKIYVENALFYDEADELYERLLRRSDVK